MKFRTRSGGRSAPTLLDLRSRFVLSVAGAKAALFLLLLALLAQGTAVQTHLHLAGHAVTFAAADEQVPASQPSDDGTFSHCVLCHQAAMAGAYLLPQVTLLRLPPTASLWIHAVTMVGLGLAAPPLGWQSRAPPQ